MICPIIREVVEIVIGFSVISLYFSKRFPLMYKSHLALAIGAFFLSEPILDYLFGMDSTILEFIGALLLLWVVERFIAVNKNSRISFYTLIIGGFAGVLGFALNKNLAYFHIGTLTAFAFISLRMGKAVEVVRWEHRDVFLISSIFLFAGAIAFASALFMLSLFLYYGGIFIFMLAVMEIMHGIM
ncbi:hypothetical protein [Thermococcus barophilus]|uniref:Uncharacterized protein n=1 Tax=Thermococcus barophilus (strain DSM 11836 / MP) TaxID=391623 RepID=F0LIZ8_THEBM|nr:hypothetical protein [Thermococcus barophilus]ADT83344.1 hypothetical protein TERMP_00367 [Thermococcus barophilus MP]